MSPIVAKRWTRIASRSPYGIGWRIRPTRRPASSSERPIARLVWLLPLPVRTEQTATTGTGHGIIVARGPSSVKSAPAARASEARCMTCS